MLIDSHCHINSEELKLEARTIINRAWEANVHKIINIGCTYEDSCEAVALAKDFQQFGLYAAIGIHPHEVKDYEQIPEEFYKLIQDERVLAIGEIGLDFHYDNSPRDLQEKFFEMQLEFAEAVDMPVILHIREAMDSAMKILHRHENLKLLFHCYSGGLDYLDEVLEFNSMCAFGGALTWNSKGSDELRETLKRMPVERILFETDSPYMTPNPFRGKRNEPAFIKYVYETAAHELNMNIKELEGQIEINAENFFGWNPSVDSRHLPLRFNPSVSSRHLPLERGDLGKKPSHWWEGARRAEGSPSLLREGEPLAVEGCN